MADSTDRSAPAPLTAILVGVLAIAALYFARQILLPVALAALFSFLLTPLVTRLERLGIGRVASVLVTVVGSFVVLSVLGWILLNQIATLSDQLPDYRSNLVAKVRSVRQAGGKLQEVTKTIEEVGKELTDQAKGSEKAAPTGATASDGERDWVSWLSRPAPLAGDESGKEDAVEVKVVQMPPSPLKQVQDWLGPLVSPLTTMGMVIVLVIFTLLQREDIRDRIIQLFGTGNLHTTTEAISDAASRVSRYLRMNLLVNSCYGLGVGVGLYFIGLPNAILWGVLATLLRFLPYLGPWIAASMPLLLSLAVFDRWSATILVAGLFVVLEVLSNNVLEPLLYGSTVGISSLGIVVAAIFWTWLWGPVGLVLAVPLTVCLVVTGNYVPQLRFFTILFSDQSSVSLPERLYQRLLARDVAEAERLVVTHTGQQGLDAVFDQLMIPALQLAERDRHSGVLSRDSAEFVVEAVRDLIESALESQPDETEGVAGRRPSPGLLVFCIPAVDDADETVAMMLAELLRRRGISAELGSADSLTSEHTDRISSSQPPVVAISVLPPIQRRNGRYLVKRLRASHPELPIVIGIWGSPDIPGPFEQFSRERATYVVPSLSMAVSQVRTVLAQQGKIGTTTVGVFAP
ncbi:MAG: AI-2E family transporter [Thermoguttaceae bacterium]